MLVHSPGYLTTSCCLLKGTRSLGSCRFCLKGLLEHLTLKIVRSALASPIRDVCGALSLPADRSHWTGTRDGQAAGGLFSPGCWKKCFILRLHLSSRVSPAGLKPRQARLQQPPLSKPLQRGYRALECPPHPTFLFLLQFPSVFPIKRAALVSPNTAAMYL